MNVASSGNETAYAKINLALHVRSKRDDGYHDLESLFAFADQGDRIFAEVDDSLSLSIEGPFAAQLDRGPDNLVLRAAQALRDCFGVRQGARLRLEKNLPVASGIGGGSADAAATMRLLSRLWKIGRYEAHAYDIAKQIGADVPACLLSRLQFGSGRGDDLQSLSDTQLSGTPLLLVNPLRPLSTADVFARWDGIDRGAIDRDRPLSNRNDLTPAATALMPEIDHIIHELRQLPGVTTAQMSGSGATCFALFDDIAHRDSGHAHIKAVLPGMWTMAACLR